MTLALKPHLGALERNFEMARHAGEFVSLVRILLEAKGDYYQARELTEKRRVSPRVKELLYSNDARTIISKAAANPLSISANAELAAYQTLVSGFVNALASIGVFDGMLASCQQVPIASTVGAVSVAASGYVVGEGSAKQVSKLSLTSGALEPQKSHCLVAVSNELLKFGGPEVQALISRDLINSAVIAVDAGFLAVLLAGVSVGTSTGQTAESVRADLAGLLAAVPTGQTSRLFVITTPLVSKMWAAMGATASNGAPAFPEMGPQGGTILNIPVIASDAVTAGQVILCDATGIAAGTDQVVLSVLREGSIIPDTSPDSPQATSTNVVSLWQMNQTAILAERWWGAEKLRSTSVAAVSNSNSYQQGFSPP
jgi:HK97 family phage major capsid protein